MNTLEAQIHLVKEGGSQSLRADFKDDPTRLANLSDTQESFLTYCNSHKVKFLESSFHNMDISNPNMNKADKTVGDNKALILVGKKDPLPLLQQADKYVEQAVKDYQSQTAQQ
jgi:N-acetylglucosamine transport system substrate-binding protein